MVSGGAWNAAAVPLLTLVAHTANCERFGVEGFPTLILYVVA